VLLIKPQGSQLEVVMVLFVLTKHCGVEDEESENKVEVDVEAVEEDGMMGRAGIADLNCECLQDECGQRLSCGSSRTDRKA
jgi:hypothetical protein